MKIGILAITVTCMFGVFNSSNSSAADPTTTTTKATVGIVSGEVVKMESGKITIKVAQMVQTGVTRRRIGSGSHARTVSIPKMGIKYSESTHDLSDDVDVKTASGKAAALTDVRPGSQVQMRVSRVSERTPGDRSESRIEVTRIIVPNPSR